MKPFNQIIEIFCRVKLPGSTLVETITASVIFMIVFVMAMDALTGIMTHNTKDFDYIVIENAISKLRREIILNTENIRPGSSSYEYKWGEIRIDISDYNDNGISLVNIDAISLTGKRMCDYRFLLAK